jgi:uncharacterized protein YjbI with pentapeptide repeats
LFPLPLARSRQLSRPARTGRSDLRQANLRQANLRQANLRQANLRQANLRQAACDVNARDTARVWIW